MTPSARSVNTQADAADQSSLLAPTTSRDGRSASSVGMASSRGGQASYASYATANTGPGSFNTALMRPSTSQDGRIRPEFDMHAITVGDNDGTTTEQRQAELQDQIEKETKIKIGSENLLEALNAKNAKDSKNQRLQVEEQLNISNRKLAQLQSGLAAEKQRAKEVKSPPADPQSRLSYLFRRNLSRSPSRHIVQKEVGEEEETESPTFVLAEILQALEIQGMQPEYYVERANSLVLLFKRHPTLKYDLAWSIFGLRMQTMLLSDSREVVAAAYRVMRYSFTDRKSLRIVRALHTDHLVILSLVKESKASVEREQALKFVRAFLDVKGGVEEIARAVVRIIVAVAEHAEDRLRNIATLTLAEILVRKPSLLVAAGGMGALADALGEGSYHAAESVGTSFLYLLDTPRRRRFLRSGRELEAPFAMFTDANTTHGHLHEEKLKVNAKVIASLLRSWPGLLTLSMNDFLPLRSLLWSLQIPTPHVRNIILELLFDLLRIKPPSWSSSFLAGRRLTTYGRVTNLKNQQIKDASASNSAEDDTTKWSLLDHYVSVVLAAFLHAGLMPALLQAEEDSLTLPLKRKTTLLIGEVLKMANELLPPSWSAQLQVLPQLLHSAARFDSEDRFVAIGTIYQVDSINRTLYRSGPTSLYNPKSTAMSDSTSTTRQSDHAAKLQAAMQVDEAQFRNLMVETQVLNTVTFTKWKWDLILNIIEGPLLNPKRLDEAIKVTKFIHRVLGFYRPFKYRFSEIKNTKPNQRYVRAGCALMQSLLQNPEGVKPTERVAQNMYHLFKSIYLHATSKEEYSVLLLGLDNAGKTTLLEQIKGTYTPSHPNLKTVPTVGQNVATIALPPPNPPIYLKIWDVGGQHSLRGLWQSYYSSCHAIVFVIDSSDVGNATLADMSANNAASIEDIGRLDECKMVLESVLANEDASGVPILILANKQDREDCVEVVRIKEGFVRRVFEGEKGGNVRDSRVLPCSALTGTGVQEAVEWLCSRMAFNKEARPPVMR